MPEYINVLKKARLFSQIDTNEIDCMLKCLCAKRVDYAKGDFIIEEGDKVQDLSIIVSGNGRSIKWDTSGREIIITLLQKGDEIGAILAADSVGRSPVTVQAMDDVSLIQIPFDRICNRCSGACFKHDKLLRNYINIVAEKGFILHERLDCLLRPTIREKIMTYLLRLSNGQRQREFKVPLNRNAMAEYLNTDRSALSRELSNMKRDGLIDYYKNNFMLIK